MKIFFVCFLALIVSCTTNKNNYCINGDTFDIKIENIELTKIATKNLLNSIINQSTIIYDKDSNYSINIKIKIRRTASLVSANNTLQINNINFLVIYDIFDKTREASIDSGNLIIVDEVNVSDNRFANYTSEEYIMENFARNLSIKLENRIKMLLKNKSCGKKISS